MNWPRVFELARQIGAMRIVGVGLKLAEVLLETELPADADEHLADDPNVPAIVRRIREDLFRQPSDGVEDAGIAKSMFHFGMRERLRDRIAWGLAQLEPTRSE